MGDMADLVNDDSPWDGMGEGCHICQDRGYILQYYEGDVMSIDDEEPIKVPCPNCKPEE